MKIGLLEDDPAQAELVISWLEEEGHEVLHANRCNLFLDLCREHLLDMAILDWQLPDQTGLDVLVTLRQQMASTMPILFSTQRSAEEDIVKALQSGADDYLTKPVRQWELLARISALGRRAGIADDSSTIELGPIQLNTQTESISLSGEPVKLTRKDYLVALCLFQHQGKVLSREFLLKSVWGIATGLDTRTVDVHVSRVRRSLKIGPEMGYTIKTIYQHGYRLEKVIA
ncbi:response regulator transcription factor [Teredinibacter waterburyi]|uniref:response regulator transcription factor n=1 Tax=Teredinibacter waterburyi TaxID=1500538 RepID=UPI00165F0800|nr:response regulator transcription factor [Teredinibacter waterburyi]